MSSQSVTNVKENRPLLDTLSEYYKRVVVEADYSQYNHSMMMRIRVLPWLTLVSLLVFASVVHARQPSSEPAASQLAVTDPYSLIAAVNDLRASNGLPAYQINSVLMAVAQAHADYMAASGSVTHYSSDGSRPFQRALAAGYPVGGDLSLGGFFSENIIAGSDMSVYAAVEAWQGDAPHLNTMLSANLTEVGAGVTIVNGYVYYVLDASQPAGSMPAYTPPTGNEINTTPGTSFLPVVMNTPNADGSITHVVQEGQALWTIAAVYETTVDEILAMNGLPNAYIFPGDKLLVRAASAQEPETPTPQPTPTASETSFPTSTATPNPVPVTATPIQAVERGGQGGLIAVGAIVVVALLAAGLLTIFSSRRESLG